MAALVAGLFLDTAGFSQSAQLLTAPVQTAPVTSNTSSASSSQSTQSARTSTSTDFLTAAPLAAAQPLVFQNGFTPQEAVDTSLAYFDASNGTVEVNSAYPFEGYREKDFTQPTAIGFYALLLANVINGSVTSSHISVSAAKANLLKLSNSLLTHQKNLGYKGLLPWLGFDGTKWTRRPGQFGEQVTFGDNANLSSALGAAIGALLTDNVKNDSTVKSIRSNLDTFLERQKPGYQYLYNAAAGRFRRGWDFVNNYWLDGDTASVDYLGDEFRGGVAFVALRYGFPDSVYTSLDRKTTAMTLSTGETLESLMPFDGGAFQMLWPTLTMPEAASPELNTTLGNFVKIALDYSKTHNLPGFLSASYSGIGQYAANAGITDLSWNNTARNETVPSLYTLGAAYQFAPSEVGAFLQQILAQYPGLASGHGFWEGVDVSTGQVIQEQISANVTSFVLGLAGTGSGNSTRYLKDKGVFWRLDTLYRPEVSQDLIGGASSFADFSARDGFFAAWTDGPQYHVLGDHVNEVLSVFFQRGIDMSAADLHLRYKSTTDIGPARLELKQRTKTGLEVRQTVNLALVNTGGAEQELVIELPAALRLLDVEEAVLVIDQGGLPLDLTFTDLHAAPANLLDAVTQSSAIYTWGDRQPSASISGDEYHLASPAFYSSGTAFELNHAGLSGAELKIHYRSTTASGKGRIELKELTPGGLVTRLTLNNVVLSNTGGAEKELLLKLPLTAALANISEAVLILEGGTGSPLDLTLTDFDFRLRNAYDTLNASQSAVVWGDNGITGGRGAAGLAISGPQFTNAYAALIQADDGVNYSGRALQIRYRSTTDTGTVRFEFKSRTPSGLVVEYVTPDIRLGNTGGAEKTAVIRLPELLQLFNIHEVVMALTGGAGTALDLTVTELGALPDPSPDVLKDAASKVTTGSTVTGSQTASGYRISATKFSSSTTTFSQNNVDVTGSRELRIRYRSTTAVGNAVFQFRVQNGSGYSTVYQTPAVKLVNTGGAETEVVIHLGDNLSLLGIDQILLQLSGGAGSALDMTITNLQIL